MRLEQEEMATVDKLETKSRNRRWLQRIAISFLLASAIAAVILFSHWLSHPQLWFGLRRFLGYGLSLLVFVGIALKWPGTGSALAIACGIILFFLMVYSEADRRILFIYGVFTLGGILNLIASGKR